MGPGQFGEPLVGRQSSFFEEGVGESPGKAFAQDPAQRRRPVLSQEFLPGRSGPSPRRFQRRAVGIGVGEFATDVEDRGPAEAPVGEEKASFGFAHRVPPAKGAQANGEG